MLIKTNVKAQGQKRELFSEGLFSGCKDKSEAERKDILKTIKKELEEKENYKPELTIYERTKLGKQLSKQLLEASDNGNLEQVKELIRKGVDVNAKDNDDWTALMFASWKGRTTCVSHLLQQPNIDVNAKSNNCNTALMLASDYEKNDCLSLLLQQSNIDVNAKNKDGRTALMFASRREKIDCVSYLLKHPNIDINAKDNEGKTALDYAKEEKQIKIIEMLRKAGAKE